MFRRFIFTSAFSVLSFFLFSQGTGKIIILHTNDMHSKIDNFGKLAYLADSLKMINPNVYLVASGDNFTGNPVVDMIRDIGFPMIDLMNRCGFDVSAYGNHEFDMGQKNLKKRIDQAEFPFISCNIKMVHSRLEQPEPFMVIDVPGLTTIAFLSAIEINENGIPDTHPDKVTGITFNNGVEELEKYRNLREKYGILIGLTHLGIQEDIRLATEMPEFDVIMGGHSHTLIDTNLIVNGVRITQAGSNLEYIGKTTLEITNGMLTGTTDEIIRVKNLKSSSPEIQKYIAEYNDNEEFKKVAGIALKPLKGENELGSMMTDAMNEEMKTDFSFQNRGGIRVSMIDSGNITIRDIYRLDPFGNKVVVFRMNEDQIKGLIKYGYELEKVPDLQVSGLKYMIRTDINGHFTGVDIVPDHPEMKKNNEYLVSMNGYMAAAYKFDYADKVKTSEKTTADILMKYLKKNGPVNYEGIKRIDLTKVK